MGEIILLNGVYKYELPKPPSKEEDILFYDLPQKDQHWGQFLGREDSYGGPFYRKKIRTLEPYDLQEYVEQERDRWENGLWFFNYNPKLGHSVPTYITGMHFDHLVNMTFDFGKARYFNQQRIDFYMRDLARKDPKCYGVVWFKPRRYGMTAEELTQSIYESMEDFNQNVGLMSLEGKKCLETLMWPIIEAVQKRPAYSRPEFYKPSGKKPRKQLEFTDGRVEFTEDEIEDDIRTLGGYIIPYNTIPSAMDGKKKAYIVMDEVWKWRGALPKETLGINRKCVEDFGIKGKISMLSTMGDSDDYEAAIKEGIEVWDESNPDIRDGNGRTISGLYRYFVSAVHSKVLDDAVNDKYGYVNEDMATNIILEDRKKYPVNSNQYIFEVRRMPLTSEEATSTAKTNALYDCIPRIQKRLDYLLGTPDKPYVFGFLEENSMGQVFFKPDPRGIWKVAQLPYFNLAERIDCRNRFRYEAGLWRPPVNPEGCIGYDPIRYADATSKNVSRGVLLGRYKYDYYGHKRAGKYAFMLIWRPSDPNLLHYEGYKACKFWGFVMNYERQVEEVKTYFRDAKALDFILNNPKDGMKGLWTDGNRQVVKEGVNVIQADMVLNVVQDQIIHDPMDDIPFEEVLQERKTFNPLKTTPFDVHMSDIMLHKGMSWMTQSSRTDADDFYGNIKKVMYPKHNYGR